MSPRPFVPALGPLMGVSQGPLIAIVEPSTANPVKIAILASQHRTFPGIREQNLGATWYKPPGVCLQVGIKQVSRLVLRFGGSD